MSKKSKITLSPFGQKSTVEVYTPRGMTLDEDPSSSSTSRKSSFDWNNALIDSFIVCMITLFTTLGGVTIAGAELGTVVISAIISAVAQFFVMLGLKRGIQVNKQ